MHWITLGCWGRTFQAWDTRRSFIKAGRIWSSIIDTPNDISKRWPSCKDWQLKFTETDCNCFNISNTLVHRCAQYFTVFCFIVFADFCMFAFAACSQRAMVCLSQGSKSTGWLTMGKKRTSDKTWQDFHALSISFDCLWVSAHWLPPCSDVLQWTICFHMCCKTRWSSVDNDPASLGCRMWWRRFGWGGPHQVACFALVAAPLGHFGN